MAARFEMQWEAPEFEYREKGVSWYWTTIIIAALIVAFSVWANNFLFGFFIVIAEVLFIFWGNREPRIVNFDLNERELTIDGRKTYEIKELESWSADTPELDFVDIFLNFRTHIKPPLLILLPHEKLDELRANLKTVLVEKPHEPSLIDSIEKFLRF